MITTLPFYEEKVWGSVWHVFSSPYASFSYLEVQAHRRCSVHKHRERANQFFVLEGSLMIETFDFTDLDSPANQHVLTAGQVYTVGSEVWHRFKVLQAGRVVEVYFPDRENAICRLDDIQRYDEGGSF